MLFIIKLLHLQMPGGEILIRFLLRDPANLPSPQKNRRHRKIKTHGSFAAHPANQLWNISLAPSP